MFDTPESLLEKIQLGEDSLIECKAVIFAGSKIKGPHRDHLADEFAAAANSTGCTFVLGVDDESREILGIPRDRLDLVESYAREICIDSVAPLLEARIERLLLPDTEGVMKAVLRVDISRSLFVHKSPGGYFSRIGSSKKELPPELLARLQQQRSQARLIRFDEQIASDSSAEDLDSRLIERFRTERSTDRAEVLAHKLAMLRQDQDGTMRLTVTGALLGTDHPERWLRSAYIQAVAYRGTTIEAGADYQLDAQDIYGPLDEQIADACRFVARNMKVRADKGVGRKDRPQYDMTAVFEAVVNAVAHRDYSIAASKIRLRMFADRLELYSPGGLANTMTLDSIPLRQVTRNEAVTSLLAKLPVPPSITLLDGARTRIMDRRGEGVPLILRRSTALSGIEPRYHLIDDSELVLRIDAAHSS